MNKSLNYSLLAPALPSESSPRMTWGKLYGSAMGLAVASAIERYKGLVILIAPNTQTALQLEQQIRFFSRLQPDSVHVFPDWETLPYDVFSPHEDIVSQRLETLYRLPTITSGLLITPISTLMQRLAPRSYVAQHSLMLTLGQKLDRDNIVRQFNQAGYTHVSQVMVHGEFTVRGSIIDLFPMGSALPYRIDLFDDEIESIRTFDPDAQELASRIPRR